MSEITSRVIAFLRFPLIVLIVFIHCNFSSVPLFAVHPIAVCFSEFISETLALVAVPAFFFISGILFFHEGTFNRTAYLRKLKRRCRTLLLPYILWNAIFIAYLFVIEKLFGHNPELGKPLGNMRVTDYLKLFWNINLIDNTSGPVAPVNTPLWFVRDLMVVCILSPVFYLLIRLYSKMHVYVQILLLFPLFYCMDRCSFTQVWLVSPSVYFVIGAYFSLNRLDVCEVFRRMYIVLLLAAIAALSLQFKNAFFLLLIFAAFGWLGRFAVRGKLVVKTLFERATFFIFASHAMLTAALFYILKNDYISIPNEIAAIALYICLPLAIVFICVLVYAVMSHYLPRCTSLLTGDR